MQLLCRGQRKAFYNTSKVFIYSIIQIDNTDNIFIIQIDTFQFATLRLPYCSLLHVTLKSTVYKEPHCVQATV